MHAETIRVRYLPAYMPFCIIVQLQDIPQIHVPIEKQGRYGYVYVTLPLYADSKPAS